MATYPTQASTSVFGSPLPRNHEVPPNPVFPTTQLHQPFTTHIYNTPVGIQVSYPINTVPASYYQNNYHNGNNNNNFISNNNNIPAQVQTSSIDPTLDLLHADPSSLLSQVDPTFSSNPTNSIPTNLMNTNNSPNSNHHIQIGTLDFTTMDNCNPNMTYHPTNSDFTPPPPRITRSQSHINNSNHTTTATTPQQHQYDSNNNNNSSSRSNEESAGSENGNTDQQEQTNQRKRRINSQTKSDAKKVKHAARN